MKLKGNIFSFQIFCINSFNMPIFPFFCAYRYIKSTQLSPGGRHFPASGAIPSRVFYRWSVDLIHLICRNNALYIKFMQELKKAPLQPVISFFVSICPTISAKCCRIYDHHCKAGCWKNFVRYTWTILFLLFCFLAFFCYFLLHVTRTPA